MVGCGFMFLVGRVETHHYWTDEGYEVEQPVSKKLELNEQFL